MTGGIAVAVISHGQVTFSGSVCADAEGEWVARACSLRETEGSGIGGRGGTTLTQRSLT